MSGRHGKETMGDRSFLGATELLKSKNGLSPRHGTEIPRHGTEIVSFGTGKLTTTARAIGGESFYRKVGVLETEQNIEQYEGLRTGQRNDSMETDFQRPDNHWDLTDTVVLEFSYAPTNPDSSGAIAEGTATLSHTIAGTRNSRGFVDTEGSHNYTTIDNTSVSEKLIEQNGVYDSTTELTSVGSRGSIEDENGVISGGTITAVYSPEGLLQSVDGSQHAKIVSSGTASATSEDHKFERVIELNNYNRTTELTSDRSTTQADSFETTITANRVANTTEDDDGILSYTPELTSSITSSVSGYRDIYNPQTLDTTVNGTTTTETATPSTNESYGAPFGDAITTEETGFYGEGYETFGFRGSVNNSGWNGVGGFSSNGEGNGSSGDGDSTGDGTSNYSTGGEGGNQDGGNNSGSEGDDDGTSEQEKLAYRAFNVVTPRGGQLGVLTAPGRDASPDVIPNNINATPTLTDYEQREIDNALVAQWAIGVRNSAIANSSQEIVDAVEKSYADNPAVQNAIILALSSHKLELSGAYWSDHWVDHSPNLPKISISSHKWYFQRSPENIAWELQGVVRDDSGFYQQFGLSNSWEGATHRIGFGGLRVVGGGAMIVIGAPMLAAPEPVLTKTAGGFMVVYGGNNVIGGGSSILGRQFAVDPIASAKHAYWDYYQVDDDIRFWGGHIDELATEAASLTRLTRLGKIDLAKHSARARYIAQFPMRMAIATQRSLRAGNSILQLAKQKPIDIINRFKAPNSGTSLVPSRYAAKTLGEWGETRLGAFLNFAGTKPTKPFITKYGARYPDRLVNGIAHEAKAGLDVRLTTKIATQIAKDKELVELGLIKGAHWHFFQGASKEVLEHLTEMGIKFTVH